MCQIGVVTGYRLEIIMFNRVVCQIGEMTGHILDIITFQSSCAADWCDYWLQVGQYNV